MAFAPVGTFLTQFDQSVTDGMTTSINGLSGYIAAPVLASIGLIFIYRAIDGYKSSNPEMIGNALWEFFRGMTALFVASNPTVFLSLADFFYTSIPAYLGTAVTSAGPGAGMPTPAGVNATAAAFDHVWTLETSIMGIAWGHTSTLDVGTLVCLAFCHVFATALIGVMALVYLSGRFILAIVLVLGVIAIGLYPIPVCRPLLEKWIGKITSLIFMQIALIVILTLVFKMLGTALAQIAATGAAASSGYALTSSTQGLDGMVTVVILILLSGFAVISLPAIAYSLGGGVSIGAGEVLLGIKAASGIGKALARDPLPLSRVLPALPPPPPSLSMGFAGGGPMTPPPPPPGLAQSAAVRSLR